MPRDGDAVPRRPRLDFDYLRCQSGVDWLNELESVYHLYSFKYGHTLVVKVRCPYDDAHMPTVSHIWAAANWHERETHEMYGIVFDGHPDLRPLLLGRGPRLLPAAQEPPARGDRGVAGRLPRRDREGATGEVGAATRRQAASVDEKAMKIQMAQQRPRS